MQSDIDAERVRGTVKKAGRSKAQGTPNTEIFPLEVVQLLDVFARIEIRRQARLRALDKDAS